MTLRVRLEPAAGVPATAGAAGKTLADGQDATDGVLVGDISYDAMGCSISQASTSVLTDLAIGRPLGDVLGTLDEFTRMVTSRGTVQGEEDVLGDGIAFAGVSKYPARVKCALLGWMAFKDAAVQSLDRARNGSESLDAAAASADQAPSSAVDHQERAVQS